MDGLMDGWMEGDRQIDGEVMEEWIETDKWMVEQKNGNRQIEGEQRIDGWVIHVHVHIKIHINLYVWSSKRALSQKGIAIS